MTDQRSLTPFEQELWAVQSTAPLSVAYNLCMAFDLQGKLNESALKSAIDVVVARHPALRSAFPTVAGSPCRVPAREVPMLPPAIPVTGGSEECARTLLGQWTAEPFDLTNGPLFCARLIRLTHERHVLAITIHHIVADGASLTVIGDQILTAYEGVAGGVNLQLDRHCRLPSDGTGEAPLSASGVKTLEHYWVERLGQLGPGLPSSAESGAPNNRGEPMVAEFALGPGAGPKCRQLARSERSSPFVVGLSAFMIFLHRWAEPHPVAIATPVDLRVESGSERNVGLYINLLPIVMQVDRKDSFRTAVRRTRNAFLEDLGHADLPFCRIAELAHDACAPDRHAVAQAAFQIAPERRTTSRAGLVIRSFSLPPAALARFPPAARTRTGAEFTVQVWMYDDAELSGVFRTGGNTSEDPSALAAAFNQTFSDLMSTPDVPIGALGPWRLPPNVAPRAAIPGEM